MDPKELALQHFEKGVLVLFAGFLVWATMGALGGEDVGATKAAVDSGLSEVSAHMGKQTIEEPDAPDWKEELGSQLDPDAVPEVDPYPSWVFHRRPGFVYYVEPDIQEYHPVHRAPVDITADDSERGRIRVAWEPSLDNIYVLTSYELYRREGDDGEWERVAELDSADTQHVDTDLESRTQYYYKVVSIADLDYEDPVVKLNDLDFPESERRKESRVAGPAGTQQDVFVWPTAVDPAEFEEKVEETQLKGWATIKIKKWVAEARDFAVTTLFKVDEGDAIEAEKRVEVGGERRMVDFSTGATLKEVELREVDRGGMPVKIHVIHVEWEDGTVEVITNEDEPD